MIYDFRHGHDLNFTFLGTTLLSQFKVSSKFKIYDPLISEQGQNEGQWPSHLSTRSVWKSIFMTLSSQYKVKMKNNDPLVSVQGQNKGQRSSHLNTRSVQKLILTTLSSQYKVKRKNN